MPRMKNVNVFVDVDLTLVDERGVMIDGADAAMWTLYDAGCTLYLWSTGGAEYCRSVAERLKIASLFAAFLPKPDVYVDDNPSTIVNGLHFDVRDHESWEELSKLICRKYVHPSQKRK